MSDAEKAWMVAEFVKRRLLREIGADVGLQGSAVCTRIREFIEDWHGPTNLVYGDERRRAALEALQSYFFETNGSLEKPRPPLAPVDRTWEHARWEHAFLLRCEGARMKDIGTVLGISTSRASQMVLRFARKLGWAMRRTRVTFQ